MPSWALITLGSIMTGGGLVGLLWTFLDWRDERRQAKLDKLRWKYVRKPRLYRGYGRMIARVKVVKEIPDEDNYFGHSVPVGTVLTVFRGATYGCISSTGIAVTTSDNPLTGPFAQLNHQYYEVL